jgi:hypothetical protein
VGADIGDDDTLAVVEANVHLEVGPGELVATDLEVSDNNIEFLGVWTVPSYDIIIRLSGTARKIL